MSHLKPRGIDPVRGIPSIVTTHRREEVGDNTRVDVRPRASWLATPPARLPKASSPPPPNVIPFTKPRAIAAIAAANPRAVAIAPAAPRGATGWTPPGATHVARAVASAAPVTAWPAPAPAPGPVITAASPVSAPPTAVPPAVPHAPPVVVAPHGPLLAQPQARWAVFERLGLGAPKLDAQTASKWLVSAYRLLGFAILTIIVFVLIGYITTTAFFYVSDSWVVPMAVTPNDEKVVSLQAQLSSQRDQRDRIADQLNQAERAIVAQQTFQAAFAKAIRGDLEGRKAALQRMRSLASTAAGTRAAIQSQNRAYAGAARKRMAQEYAAGMIDRDGMLSGRYQLAQISSSNLSLAERQAEYETRAAELEDTARSLDAILADAEDAREVTLSYEVLQIKQQYETSRLELAKAIEMRDSLETSLERQDKILAALEGSAYLRAIDDQATVAFVPYGNLGDVKPGEPLYACRLTMVLCYRVGQVLEVIPGEVQFKHPHRDKNLRGQLVELKLDDDEPDAGMEDHLFVGGRPFLL